MKHKKETIDKMRKSRLLYLSNHEFIAPVLKMTKNQKKKWRQKISENVKKIMKRKDIRKSITKNRKTLYKAWNKGIPTPKAAIRKRLRTIKKHYTKEQIHVWCSKGGAATVISKKSKQSNWKMFSKVENSFLKHLENELKIKIKRQALFIVNNNRRRADGFIEKLNIVIEVDGVYYHNYPFGTEKDKLFNEYCKKNKLKLFRFWDKQIFKNEKRCIAKVVNYINKHYA
jgi:very-short-patch-repair endonuclease